MNAYNREAVDWWHQHTQVIRLYPKEVIEALLLGAQRCSYHDGFGKFENTEYSPFDDHANGGLGEKGFVHVNGGKVDETVYMDGRGDRHRPDCELPDGRRVEVKTIRWVEWNGDLKMERVEIANCEWVCLAQRVQNHQRRDLLDVIRIFPIWRMAVIRPFFIEKPYTRLSNGLQKMTPAFEWYNHLEVLDPALHEPQANVELAVTR